ncbi:wiskott-Aldrich syndrome protein family member 1-like [Sus scrofa]|uniref:wiskott-Aldrich syndrome protein family member 1-like n=1 Tax=Sus scrofa TaxID=9823 RepID=UPI000A2B5945|nr:wiskott-Aldrich syndrome protein family member 1-like [Sus scrofa]
MASLSSQDSGVWESPPFAPPHLPASSRRFRSGSRPLLRLSPAGPRPLPGRRDSAPPPSSLRYAPGGHPGNCSRPPASASPRANCPNRKHLSPMAELARALPAPRTPRKVRPAPCQTPFQPPSLRGRAAARAVRPRADHQPSAFRRV